MNQTLVWLLVLVTIFFDAAVGQSDTDKQEFNSTFKDLIVANDLKEGESFRCGVFFAGESIGEKPRETVFIIPKRFEAQCGSDEPDKYKKFCFDLFNKFTKFMTWKTTSKKRGAPYVVGDDVCYVLKQTKLKNPPPNKRFPDGITVGFYYNYCADSTWYDTELRVTPNICCKPEEGKDDWLYTDCP